MSARDIDHTRPTSPVGFEPGGDGETVTWTRVENAETRPLAEQELLFGRPHHGTLQESMCSGFGGVGDEIEGEAVHAIPLTSRSRPIGEQVTEVRATAPAADLRADHAMTGVFDQLDGVGILRLVEARPSTARLELRRRIEQLCAACRAVVRAVGVLVDVLAAPGALGACTAQHFVLLGRSTLPANHHRFVRSLASSILLGSSGSRSWLEFFHAGYTSISVAFTDAKISLPGRRSNASNAPMVISAVSGRTPVTLMRTRSPR